MSYEEIFNYVSNHPSGRVKVAVADIDGVLRGKYISVEKFLSVAQSNLGFCDVIFGWDMTDQAYDNSHFFRGQEGAIERRNDGATEAAKAGEWRKENQ